MKSNYAFNSFSVVIPVFNEEEIIEESINSILSICSRTNLDYEIIISENGSIDNTLSIAEKICNNYSEVILISSKTPNYGQALRDGFLNAHNPIIISFDIDYYSETFLKQALTLGDNYVALTASKRMMQSNDGRKFIRKIATNIFVSILKILFNTSLSDTHGMKALKKEVVNKYIYDVVSTQDIFDTELLLRIERGGFKIKEIPAIVNEIRPSVSVIYKRIPRTIKSLLKLRLRFYKESLKTKNL